MDPVEPAEPEKVGIEPPPIEGEAVGIDERPPDEWEPDECMPPLERGIDGADMGGAEGAEGDIVGIPGIVGIEGAGAEERPESRPDERPEDGRLGAAITAGGADGLLSTGPSLPRDGPSCDGRNVGTPLGRLGSGELALGEPDEWPRSRDEWLRSEVGVVVVPPSSDATITRPPGVWCVRVGYVAPGSRTTVPPVRGASWSPERDVSLPPRTTTTVPFVAGPSRRGPSRCDGRDSVCVTTMFGRVTAGRSRRSRRVTCVVGETGRRRKSLPPCSRSPFTATGLKSNSCFRPLPETSTPLSFQSPVAQAGGWHGFQFQHVLPHQQLFGKKQLFGKQLLKPKLLKQVEKLKPQPLQLEKPSQKLFCHHGQLFQQWPHHGEKDDTGA